MIHPLNIMFADMIILNNIMFVNTKCTLVHKKLKFGIVLPLCITLLQRLIIINRL